MRSFFAFLAFAIVSTPISRTFSAEAVSLPVLESLLTAREVIPLESSCHLYSSASATGVGFPLAEVTLYPYPAHVVSAAVAACDNPQNGKRLLLAVFSAKFLTDHLPDLQPLPFVTAIEEGGPGLVLSTSNPNLFIADYRVLKEKRVTPFTLTLGTTRISLMKSDSNDGGPDVVKLEMEVVETTRIPFEDDSINFFTEADMERLKLDFPNIEQNVKITIPPEPSVLGEVRRITTVTADGFVNMGPMTWGDVVEFLRKR